MAVPVVMVGMSNTVLRMVRRVMPICVGALLAFTPLCAQTGLSVSGTVVNSASVEPVKGALVEVFAPERKSALTGADGHFQLDGLNGGLVTLSVRRPGFAQLQQNVKVGANLDAVRLELIPLSRISGRILDGEGEPIEGIFVQCIAQQIVGGRKQWAFHGGAFSDEGGGYEIEDLPPGTYILLTRQKELYITQPKSEAARYVFPSGYYPNAPSRDLAQHLDLAPGVGMRADITLHEVRGTRVSVTMVPAVEGVTASIGQEDDQFGASNSAAGKSGEVIFPAVPPGSWKIVGRTQWNNEGLYGELVVGVGSADIENLKLPLGKVADISVSVTGEEKSKVFLQLFSKAGMVGGSNSETDGQLKVQGVPPGTYRVVARVNGSDSCVTSMMSGSQDLLHDYLVVAAGAPVTPIQIIASTNCAQLTMNTNTKGQRVLIVTSSNPVFEPIEWQINADSVKIKTLADGDYRVYAFDDVSNLEYANPDAMRDFKGEDVHLEAGQKASVQLEVNVRTGK